jgi:putative FmdB family regulatory protein
MPVYEFECSKCEKATAMYFASFKESQGADLVCPFCAGELTRKISAPVAHVHGYNAKNGYSIVRGDG